MERSSDLRGPFATEFAGILFGILLLQTIVPVAAQSREIAYDNGTLGGSVSLPYAPQMWSGGWNHGNDDKQFVWMGNQMFAVRFTPSIKPEMLLGVRFFIAEVPESFNVWLFDSDKFFISYAQWDETQACGLPDFSYIPYRWTVTPASTGWIYLNITDPRKPIFITNDFYVAIEFTVDQKPRIGVDATGPRSDRGWIVENQTDEGWIAYSTYAKQHELPDGNLMIRAVTVSLPEVRSTESAQTSSETLTQTVTITTTVQTSALQEWMPLISTTLAGSIMAVGVWHIRKH